MKDQDFDEIGKRLYDMEADPPQDGWDKLYGGLHSVPPRGKLVFFRKHWWKPFVLLIPLATYYFISDSGNTGKTALVSSSKTSEATRAPRNTDGTSDADSISAISGENPVTPDSNVNETNAAQSSPNMPGENSSSQKSTVDPGENLDGRSGTQPLKNSTPLKETNSALSQGTSERKDITPIAEKEVGGGGTVTGAIVSEETAPNDPETKAENRHDNPTGEKAGKSVVATEVLSQDTDERSELISSGDGARSNAASENLLAPQVAGVDQISGAAQDSSKHVDKTSTKKHAAFAGPALPTGLSTNATKSQDSLSSMDKINLVKSDSSVMHSNTDAEESNETLGPWRVSLGITPQYVDKIVKPLPDDEVMMFVNSDNSRNAGLVASVGIGRAISRNFYLDLQFSLQRTSQDISYSYSTGAVDTLLALRQADGTVIVSPVHELSTTEITTNYTYGGMRLTGTYYLWSNARGRFNLTAGAGLNSLIDASIYENSNGEWMDVSDDYEKKTNYSLSVSGGYSFIFRKGWELMINPVLTYYPSNEQIRDLPFGIQRKSYGLNFTLLKNLRTRK